MNKDEVLQNLKKYNLDSEKFIIIGSASLVMHGLKDSCADIDIAVSREYNDYLLDKFTCRFDANVDGYDIYMIDDIINFSNHYYDEFKGQKIDGYWVQTLDEVLNLKRKLNREKDKKDIELILNYLNQDINSLALAYLGDATYELYIRKYLTSKGNYKVKELGEKAKDYVSAKAQSNYLDKMVEDKFLTKEEEDIVRRARNHKVLSHPKNTSIIAYKKATGLEALLGYHETKNNQKRINEIMKYIVGD